jgi:hypothetical protein
MPRRILIFDTSILCCLLKIPGKDTAGPKDDRWNYDRIATLVATETKLEATFVLPLASIIETGNHIAQAPRDRFVLANGLAALIADAADANSPWAAFADQDDLWRTDQLKNLAASWPTLAAAGFSIGDATIKDVAEYYAEAGFAVEILTGDAGLKAYQPTTPALIPRRRQ